MSEMTGRIDMQEFSQKTSVASDQIIGHLQDLAKTGFVKKVGGGFALTERGKLAIKAVEELPQNLKFQFYVGFNQPTSEIAGSVEEFRKIVANIDVTSLEFHLCRGDFDNWFKTAVRDPAFVTELSRIRKAQPKCDELRDTLVKALEKRYGL
jgi:hypothetical protein